MTFDKFLKRNKMISDYLAQIAVHRDGAGWVNCAKPLDDSFRDLLAAQERLLTAAARLLESRSLAADSADVDSLAIAAGHEDLSSPNAMLPPRSQSPVLSTTH